MSSGVTVANIRTTCGILTAEISDADVTALIIEAEKAVEKYLNTSIGATTKIEYLDSDMGHDSRFIKLMNTPILNVLSIKINGTSISPKYVKVYRGMLRLLDTAEKKSWDNTQPQNNLIKYQYGLLEETTTETTLSTAVTTPTADYEVTIGSSTGLSNDDWIKLEGMDGYREVTQFETVGTGTAKCDLNYPHEATSRVILMEVPSLMKRLVEIITSIMMVARIVGASYDDIVGYSLGDMSVQKGEPYTQWRETYKQLDDERKIILKSLRPQPIVV